MTWTRVLIEIDIDGESGSALEHGAELLSRIFDDERVIAASVESQRQHGDDCDDDPCICATPEGANDAALAAAFERGEFPNAVSENTHPRTLGEAVTDPADTIREGLDPECHKAFDALLARLRTLEEEAGGHSAQWWKEVAEDLDERLRAALAAETPGGAE